MSIPPRSGARWRYRRRGRYAPPAGAGKRSIVLRVAAATLSLVIVLVALDGAWALSTFTRSIGDLSEELDSGARLLSSLKLEGAEERFSQALDAAAAVEAATQRPAFLIASRLPWTRADTGAIEALSRATEIASRAGLDAVEAARSLGLDDADASESLYEDRRIRLDVFEAAAEEIKGVRTLLNEADEIVQNAPQPRYEVLEQGLERAHSRLDAATQMASDGHGLLDALPDLLGGEDGRRYMLAFQAPSEARGSGGLVGLLGILDAEAGRLRLRDVRPFGELAASPLDELDAPQWYQRRYEQLLDLPWGEQWQDANLTADFPAAARVLLQLFEASTGESLDGVIAMDPFVFGELTEATGAVSASHLKLNIPVTSDNAQKLLLHDIYLQLPLPEAQNRYLKAILKGLWMKLSRGQLKPAVLLDALATSIRTQRLKIYSVIDSERELLRRLGSDGSLSGRTKNLQLIWHNNLAGNKVDYFLSRDIATSVELTETGRARVETTLTLTNRAPAGPPSVLLGSALLGVRPGYNQMELNVLLPKDARVKRFKLGAKKLTASPDEEAGFPVLTRKLTLKPDEQVRVVIVYVIPDAVDEDVLSLTLLPQAWARTDSFSLVIEPPEGMLIKPADRPQADAEGSLELSGAFDREIRVEALLVRDN